MGILIYNSNSDTPTCSPLLITYCVCMPWSCAWIRVHTCWLTVVSIAVKRPWPKATWERRGLFGLYFSCLNPSSREVRTSPQAEQELEAGTEAETMVACWLPDAFPHRWFRATCWGLGYCPQWVWISHISPKSRQHTPVLPIGQSDRGIFLVYSCPSLMMLAFVKLTEN